MNLNKFKKLFNEVKAYYQKHPCGGTLHIVLDDGNLCVGHIKFCMVEARKEGDTHAIAIAEALLELSEVEITLLYKLYPYTAFPGWLEEEEE